MTTAVDTNILLDLLTPDATFADSSVKALDAAGDRGPVVICEAVYAELSSKFLDQEGLDEFLRMSNIEVVRSELTTLHTAGSTWLTYTRRRPEGLVCNQCGVETQARCSRCDATITLRQRVLSDFLVGAHATAQADRLLTRDLGRYRTYFPDLELI